VFISNNEDTEYIGMAQISDILSHEVNPSSSSNITTNSELPSAESSSSEYQQSHGFHDTSSKAMSILTLQVIAQ
jgi:hypothetical protein